MKNKKEDIDEALTELIKWNSIKELVKNDTLAASITIDGRVLDICDNKMILPLIDRNINEIEKFLKGNPNKWQ